MTIKYCYKVLYYWFSSSCLTDFMCVVPWSYWLHVLRPTKPLTSCASSHKAIDFMCFVPRSYWLHVLRSTKLQLKLLYIFWHTGFYCSFVGPQLSLLVSSVWEVLMIQRYSWFPSLLAAYIMLFCLISDDTLLRCRTMGAQLSLVALFWSTLLYIHMYFYRVRWCCLTSSWTLLQARLYGFKGFYISGHHGMIVLGHSPDGCGPPLHHDYHLNLTLPGPPPKKKHKKTSATPTSPSVYLVS